MKEFSDTANPTPPKPSLGGLHRPTANTSLRSAPQKIIIIKNRNRKGGEKGRTGNRFDGHEEIS
ncbi:hypothetical protein AKJ37_03995 [candidate division MSBL1 archaeon SCGC-AAA259I09]|uniref:Uncharacterized protein n=1 Tax=candidate division MSBL1 archaeon SCGC-AAA259I09 TaxID=1698267 RepID=A0A133US16_9EURY|nr:hypothetical protein AKJ37_03995 [candidate division MSBL1 archaeon SCGC-AAA259I09]